MEKEGEMRRQIGGGWICGEVSMRNQKRGWSTNEGRLVKGNRIKKREGGYVEIC